MINEDTREEHCLFSLTLHVCMHQHLETNPVVLTPPHYCTPVPKLNYYGIQLLHKQKKASMVTVCCIAILLTGINFFSIDDLLCRHHLVR
jgi:hypothetical protein